MLSFPVVAVPLSQKSLFQHASQVYCILGYVRIPCAAGAAASMAIGGRAEKTARERRAVHPQPERLHQRRTQRGGRGAGSARCAVACWVAG